MPSAAKADAAKKKKTTSSAKDKEIKDKPPKSSKEKKDKKETKPSTAAAAATPEPPAKVDSVTTATTAALDPDAVQLFRRYDTLRTGHLARRDFLRLLKEYAEPVKGTKSTHGVRFPPRLPLSLTDSRGIPLGYERSEKNSEFEAGQLFERYDKDHTGTLTLDKFHVFFNDFRVQLRAFVEELSYGVDHPTTATDSRERSPTSTSSFVDNDAKTQSTPPDSRRVHPLPDDLSVDALRVKWQSLLWELRKICKDELPAQRDRIIDTITELRSNESLLSESPRHILADTQWRGDRHAPWSLYNHSNQLADMIDTLERDLERINGILRSVRQQIRRGSDQPRGDLVAFLAKAPDLLSDARELAMKSFSHWRLSRRLEAKDERETSSRPQRRPVSPLQSPGSGADAASSPRSSPVHQQSIDELRRTLAIKDQMIFQLLQERTTLRRQKASIESYLQDVTEMSTQEMKKWAQLTDDMQAEIVALRRRLETAGERDSSDE